MAAAYLFHIVQNHPFIDGNKRAGAMCAYVFLARNDRELDAPEVAFEHLVWQVASWSTSPVTTRNGANWPWPCSISCRMRPTCGGVQRSPNGAKSSARYL